MRYDNQKKKLLMATNKFYIFDNLINLAQAVDIGLQILLENDAIELVDDPKRGKKPPRSILN